MTNGVGWDPAQYQRFADERGRPFHELLGRVFTTAPRRVVDLGCGPGRLTATLVERWPTATIEGIDSAAEMIAEAAPRAIPARLTFRLQDLVDWSPAEPVDVLVSNATLQWVPSHLEVVERLVEHVSPGGWLAFQVPGNFDEPSHRLLHALAAEPEWAELLAGADIRHPAACDAATYLDLLASLGHQVDAWETTYFHVLDGPDAVFEWITGTGARPVLRALPDEQRTAFEEAYRARLREAYPQRAYGTVLPFRRVFVAARVDA